MMFVIIVVCVIFLAYKYVTRNGEYWRKRGIAGPKPTVIFGNFGDVFTGKKGFGEMINEYYKMYPNETYVGLFNGTKPIIVPRDPDVAKLFLIKDFNHFVDRGFAFSNDALGKNLFNSEQDTWKVLRQNLTPVFSSGKLKNMFYLIHECGLHFQKYVGEIIDQSEIPEIRDVMGRYTLEVICSCAFGIEVETLKRGSNLFHDMGKKVNEPSTRESVLRFLDAIFPGILKVVKVSIIKPEVEQFFFKLVREIVQARQGKPKVRQDFMDLILSLKERGKVTGGKFKNDNDFSLEITDTVMAAQAFIFFGAGFETSSALMSFALYELAKNPSMQERVRKEINDVMAKHEGITYESLHEMEYLEMVLSETHRKYPIGEFLLRLCVKKYQLPGTNVTIDEGVQVVVPTIGWYGDAQYYPDPEKFDPERFAPDKRDNSAPYMPFGEGPRNCIGLRFAKVSTLLGMCLFLQRYGVRTNANTESKLQYHKRTVTLTAVNGIWLDVYRV